MPNKCIKCSVEDPKEFVNCDSCKKILCKKCSDLSETEFRCIALRKRRLTFLCENCEKGIMLIPDIMIQLDDLRKQVNDLKSELQAKNSKSEQEVDAVESEDIISELMERQRRASNIIISNIKEPSSNSRENRTEDDKRNVADILKDINVDLSNIKVFRLGKFMPSKNRLLKVVLNNSEDAVNVLRNKRNVTVPSIRIFGDQTKKQQNYFHTIKKQLEDLKANGDDTKTIRFINNKPTIVKKTVNLN